ncbi:MAG TPA: hypothetical protein VKG62_03980, partial [Solirubrobacteraceae bacterium]|nr:hypothetical protein [Solirubrobacteraceae bacterium]
RVGHTALLAQVGEQSREVVDSAMTQLGGSVFRRPTLDVEAEIAEADEAQRVAKKEARKRLHEQHHAEHQEKVHEKVDALKAKLHHSQPVGSTGS